MNFKINGLIRPSEFLNQVLRWLPAALGPVCFIKKEQS
jgi:hypothetical protein